MKKIACLFIGVSLCMVLGVSLAWTDDLSDRGAMLALAYKVALHGLISKGPEIPTVSISSAVFNNMDKTITGYYTDSLSNLSTFKHDGTNWVCILKGPKYEKEEGKHITYTVSSSGVFTRQHSNLLKKSKQ